MRKQNKIIVAISPEEERKLQNKKAVETAKNILKKGDRVCVTKCPGTKRTITFDHWDGCWMVSKSGIDDYHPVNISVINGIKTSMK